MSLPLPCDHQLGFNFIVSNFYSLYYGTGASKAGFTSIKAAFDETKEGDSEAGCTRKTFHRALLAPYYILGTALATAQYVDNVNLRVELRRRTAKLRGLHRKHQTDERRKQKATEEKEKRAAKLAAKQELKDAKEKEKAEKEEEKKRKKEAAKQAKADAAAARRKKASKYSRGASDFDGRMSIR